MHNHLCVEYDPTDTGLQTPLPQFRQSAGGRAFAGRNEGLAHHLDLIRRKGVDAETAHLATGDAAWVARPK